MTILGVLEAIKYRIAEDVASQILLPNPKATLDGIPRVNPKSYLGHIPPEDYNPESYTLPGIIVGIDEGTDDLDVETEIPIIINFVLYRDVDDGADPTGFDMSGYKDLLVIIQKARTYFAQNRQVCDSEGKGVAFVQAPFKFGLHQEQIYPYWYGYLRFKVTTAPSAPSFTFE